MEFYIGYARGIILQSYYFLVTLVASWLQVAATRDWLRCCLYGFLFRVPPSNRWIIFCQPLPISIRWHLLCRFGICIDFCDDLPDWSCDWDLYALGTSARKLEDRKYQIGAGVIAVVITLLVIQMGLTVLSTVPMASIQNRLNASGLIRFIILHTPISSSLFHNLWVTAIIGA